MSLSDKLLSLTLELRRTVHLLLCDHALKVWKKYASAQGTITYGDSVVGMLHDLDGNLPGDALESLRSVGHVVGCEEISKRYREPIVALQDDDLEFPESVEFAYYAIYNCFRKYGLHQKIDDWLIANQALSSMKDESKIDRLLEEAILIAEGSE